MSHPHLQRKDLAVVVNQQLLPWLQAPVPRVLLAEPPLHVPAGVVVTHHAAPVLSQTRKATGYLQLMHWPEAAMHAGRFPLLVLVLEGEADMRIGATRSFLARPAAADECGYYVLSLPAPTLLVVPAGVPYSDGSQPHWERPHLEKARSRVLTLNILPEATLCHTCATLGASHKLQSTVAVADAQLLTLAQLLIDELRNRAPYGDDAAHSLALLFMLRIARGLVADEPPLIGGAPLQTGKQPEPNPSEAAMTLDRACRYIQANLHEPLTPSLIAAHAFVSPSQLKRVFRSELNTSVMRWVTQARIEAAKSLLENTNLPVQEIARYLGFAHPPHFTLTFSQQVGLSPRQYRRRNDEESVPNI